MEPSLPWSSWSCADVGRWLRAQGFAEHEELFAANKISGAILPELTRNALRDDLGIAAFGDRVRLSQALEALIAPPYVGTSDAQVGTAMSMQLRICRNMEFLQVMSASSPANKRRRLESDEELQTAAARLSTNTAATASPLVDTVTIASAAAPARELTPHRPVATIIEQFVSTFTRGIANDDNVSFIPNAGRFALYALYCKLMGDTSFHPKREDVFYKMTSMHGKVDRQRVNRYYQWRTEDGETQVVQFKPQGKGVLLRRYRKVGSDEELEDVVKVAPFVSWLHLDPMEVVAVYERFVDSFVPITKSDYRALNSGDKPHDGVHV